jgi:predicted flap endonuclease-1-like 5' DNA nuclease
MEIKMKIIEIEGIGDKYAKILEKAGIAEVENLIPLTWRELKELAAKTKISLKLLEKWQDQADIMELKGVGPEYSEVLNKVGIDSIKELSYRNPQKTLDRIVEFDKKQPDVIRKIPELGEIEGWISQSKEMYEKKKAKTTPKTTPIVEIEGVGTKYSKALEKAGVSNVEDLISFDSVKMKSLSATTKISEKLIDKWAEHADLMRIGGVGPEYADVLNQIGVDSVKELAQRNPKNTLDRIMELDNEKPDVFRKPPRLEEIEDWIEEAKKIK